ncbi:hypothetical protein E1287_06285 [Actinomadura sp. KC06]|uniref:hypothetical protein n=1 Tax=Actinomadura sp. KC06 TaxID=2530369 RepID=UPI001045E248|nr:hypothetical protein [Actinomadura sp. KC06]TDD38154.1 hypothetical protein E1287_06285 [Actinomadura sp. KC06]
MNGLLGELGKKLAERWLSLLVLPGALYLAVAAAAVTLGHGHALDVGRLAHEITRHAKSPSVTNAGGQVVLLAAVLAGAAVVGLIVQALGVLVERLSLAAGWRRWPRPVQGVVRRWVDARQRRWDAAHAAWHAEYQGARAPDPADRPDPAARHKAARDRDRIAVERPARPTWSGDRVHAVAVRLDRHHHLDLATVWPQLWLILPDAVRRELNDARADVARAATLGAWAVLYVPLAVWWWPAAPIAIVIAVTARHRIRTSTNAYARFLEAATRMHATTLAVRLGIVSAVPADQPLEAPPIRPLDRDLGRALTRHLRTHLPPPRPPAGR